VPTTKRHQTGDLGTALRGDSRPVLLVTFFSVPFDPAASVFAVDSAIEAGQSLIVINIVELPPLPMSVRLGYDHIEDPPEIAAALRAPAELASSLGVNVERMLVKTPRPVTALLEVIAERRPGLLVIGADPRLLSGRFYRRVRNAVRDRTECLVWHAGAIEENPTA